MKMDSAAAGNSGSLQSSSGGDGDRDDDPSHEFHSRPGPSVDPLSSFFQYEYDSSSYQLMSTALQPHHHHHHPNTINMNDSLSNFSLSQLELPPAAAATPTPTPSPSPSTTSRKRTRASRRAPTTVLTTDTSNFRAMVQEFTGIPAPPFYPPSSYLLRPFAHKLNTSTCTVVGGTAIDALQTSDQAHGQSTLLNNNMPANFSQLLSFQSLLQSQHLTQPKYDLRSMHLSFASRPAAAAPAPAPSMAAHGLLGSSDTLHQGGCPGTASGSVSAPADGADMPDPDSIQRSACSDYVVASTQTQTQQQRHLQIRERAAASSSCKLSSSTGAGSSSELYVNVTESIREGEQDHTRVVAVTRWRGEGMVDSWLCSSSSSSDHR